MLIRNPPIINLTQSIRLSISRKAAKFAEFCYFRSVLLKNLSEKSLCTLCAFSLKGLADGFQEPGVVGVAGAFPYHYASKSFLFNIFAFPFQ